MKVDYVFDEGSSKEDAYLIKDSLYGVFDGFNSLIDKYVDKENRTGGLLAATIARKAFSEGGQSLSVLAKKANEHIKNEMIATNVEMSDKARLWGTALAVIRVRNDFFEWVQIADCLILVIHTDGSFQMLIEDYDHDQDAIVGWKRLADKKMENIRELVEEDTRSLRRQVNKSYGAMTGEDEALKFLKSGEAQLDNVSDIILFTDGFILPKKNPQEDNDWKMFVDLYKKGGLDGVRSFVRDLEKNDPKCWKYPRYKVHDDMTAISLSFP